MCIFGALKITGGAVSVLELPFSWHDAHTLLTDNVLQTRLVSSVTQI